jgi:hypothetical protein
VNCYSIATVLLRFRKRLLVSGSSLRFRVRRSLPLLLACCLAQPALAGQIDLDGEAGFDGYYRVGRWLPVRVDISNTGPDLDGELVVNWGDFHFEQVVALPAPSRKSVEFYVRAQDGQNELELELLTAGRSVASVSLAVQPLSDEELLVLKLPGTEGFSAGANDVVVRLEASELPRRWNGLDPVQIVVGNPDQFDRLDEERKESLRYWLSAGGRLESGSGPVGETLPVHLDDGRILDSIRDILTPRSGPGNLVVLILAGILVLLSLALPGFAAVVGSPSKVFVGLALTALVASTGVGLWGSGWPVPVLETVEFSIFRSREGHSVASVTTDGTLRSGAKDLFHIRTGDDIHFGAVSGASSTSHVFFEDGSFEFQQPLGLGQSMDYRLTGFVAEKPLHVEVSGAVLEISIAGDWLVSECLAVDQYGAFRVPELLPGQSVKLDLRVADPRPTFFESPSPGERMLSRLWSEDQSMANVACVSEGPPSLTVDGATVRGLHTALLIRYFTRESSESGMSPDGKVSYLSPDEKVSSGGNE